MLPPAAEGPSARALRRAMLLLAAIAAPASTFDCWAAFEHRKAGWSIEKKQWCCRHKGVGCPYLKDQYAGSSDAFCCVAAPDEDDVCGSCPELARMTAGSACGTSKSACRSGRCGALTAWCDGGDGAGDVAPAGLHDAIPPPHEEASFCCLASLSRGDVCGTCFTSARAAGDTPCGSSQDSCESCGGGATWCGRTAADGAASGTKASPAPTPSPSPAPTSAPKPSPRPGPTPRPAPGEETPYCCLAAEGRGGDFCGTCLPNAKAADGSRCGASEAACAACGGLATWCGPGARAAGTAGAPPAASGPGSTMRAGRPGGGRRGRRDSAGSTAGSVTEGYCCLAAEDHGDFCGSCFPHGRADADGRCGRSSASCASCGGRATWCGAPGHRRASPSGGAGPASNRTDA